MPILSLIVLLPLAGFVLNGLFATQLVRAPRGRAFVSAIGCGLPIASYLLAGERSGTEGLLADQFIKRRSLPLADAATGAFALMDMPSWTTWSSSAARVKLPWRATASTRRSWFQVTRIGNNH